MRGTQLPLFMTLLVFINKQQEDLTSGMSEIFLLITWWNHPVLDDSSVMDSTSAK